MADYQSIRYMEESLELSTNIPEDLILSISIPLILTLKNQRQKDQFQVDYKKLFYRLKSILINEISDIHQLINYQVSEVLKLIRNLEPQFNWNSFDENDIQSIIEYLLSDLFVGVCSTTVLLHIYDQILLFSSNSTKDMLLPSIQNWITWTVASIIIITLNCEKIDFKIDTAKEYIHSIKANALMKTLNEYFINTIRDSITATTTSNLSNTEEVDIDDVVSITEEDFEDLQTSVFEREVIVWKKKKAFKKNIRIRILFSSNSYLIYGRMEEIGSIYHNLAKVHPDHTRANNAKEL
ncbi:hypothetical protein HDV02_001248 [Globomyces sp. JEL0801]|nr:hypothetical protein HDV02_001248 [Globomyces sp. JEL0801]